MCLIIWIVCAFHSFSFVIIALMGDEGEDLRGVDFITVASCVSFCHSLLCSSFLFWFCSFFLPSSNSVFPLLIFTPFFLPAFPFFQSVLFFFGSLGILWKWCQVRYNSCSQGLVPVWFTNKFPGRSLTLLNTITTFPLSSTWRVLEAPLEKMCVYFQSWI